MGDIDWILEIVLVGLLGVTLVHAIRLERALRALRQDRAAFGEADRRFRQQHAPGGGRASASCTPPQPKAAQVAGPTDRAGVVAAGRPAFLIDRRNDCWPTGWTLSSAPRAGGCPPHGCRAPRRTAGASPRCAARPNANCCWPCEGASDADLLRPLPRTIAVHAGADRGQDGGVGAGGRHRTARAHASTPAPVRAASRPPEKPVAERAAHARPAARAAPSAEPPVSEAERAVLQDLRARRAQLEAQVARLETREAMLAAAERRLAERVHQLSRCRPSSSSSTRPARARRGELARPGQDLRDDAPARRRCDLQRTGSAVLHAGAGSHEGGQGGADPGRHGADRARAVTAQLAQWRNTGQRRAATAAAATRRQNEARAVRLSRSLLARGPRPRRAGHRAGRRSRAIRPARVRADRRARAELVQLDDKVEISLPARPRYAAACRATSCRCSGGRWNCDGDGRQRRSDQSRPRRPAPRPRRARSRSAHAHRRLSEPDPIRTGQPLARPSRSGGTPP